ncbi:MAG: GNAT family N-acetyltransferase [Candidatus Falkowbacteria bacterium]
MINQQLVDSLLLRPCSDADKQFVHDLSRENMGEMVSKYWGSWNEAAFMSKIRPEQITMLEYQGQLIGFFDVEVKDDALYLHNMQLKKSFQGQGIGLYLLALAEKRARQHHLKKMVLRVFCENKAKNLYENAGFVVTAQEGPTVVMEKLA